jgi:hypothetical protein
MERKEEGKLNGSRAKGRLISLPFSRLAEVSTRSYSTKTETQNTRGCLQQQNVYVVIKEQMSAGETCYSNSSRLCNVTDMTKRKIVFNKNKNDKVTHF